MQLVYLDLFLCVDVSVSNLRILKQLPGQMIFANLESSWSSEVQLTHEYFIFEGLKETFKGMEHAGLKKAQMTGYF